MIAHRQLGRTGDYIINSRRVPTGSLIEKGDRGKMMQKQKEHEPKVPDSLIFPYSFLFIVLVVVFVAGGVRYVLSFLHSSWADRAILLVFVLSVFSAGAVVMWIERLRRKAVGHSVNE